ncbi:MAG TPA: hypothetical protein VFN61_07540 [Acidimicrobiales bacterium]|nr:hypothetical protein [Acidimicrobiales bacterium]
MPDLVDRARPPANATDAVDLLLRICPEFGPAWSSLRELMGEEPAISVGIYNVFGQIVLPFLLYALDGDTGSDFHIPYLGCAADVGDAHRRAFRDEAQWAAMPARGTRQLEDLVGRLYAVLDLWAATDDRSLRDALYVEMAETGYVDLSSEVLLGYAGNNLRALAGLAQQSAVDDQPRQA